MSAHCKEWEHFEIVPVHPLHDHLVGKAFHLKTHFGLFVGGRNQPNQAVCLVA